VHLGWCFNGVRVGVGFDFGLHADHFVFIGFGDFCSHDLHHASLPASQVTRIYNHTTIINNYTIVNNKTVINNGIKVEQVAAATHTQIKPVVVRDLPAGARASAGVHSSGKELAVYRPQLKAPATPVKMVAQKVDAQRPVIHHTEIATSTARNERQPGTHQSTPANSSSRTYQSEPTRSAPHSAPQNTAPPRSDNSAPRSSHSTAVEAPLVPKAHTIEEVNNSRNAEASSSRNTARSAPGTELNPATHSSPGYHPEAQTSTYPRRSSPQDYSGSKQNNNSGNSAHDYYPKSYHQAAEVRSLPAGNGPSGRDSSTSSSGGHNSSGRDAGSSNSGHGSDARSGK
jgi:hypothetical protein